jgi:hypothetical protein
MGSSLVSATADFKKTISIAAARYGRHGEREKGRALTFRSMAGASNRDGVRNKATE